MNDDDTGSAVLAAWAMVGIVIGMALVLWLLATGD